MKSKKTQSAGSPGPESSVDPYGFTFWLKWILWFGASFVAASLFWTGLLKAIFLKIAGPELTVTWALAVFGSWFLLMIPFIRKKEQVWKRLNQDEEKAASLWLKGFGLFLLGLIGTCFVWSFYFREAIGENSVHSELHRGWLKAVLVTWLLTALPFLAFLYKKADQIYKFALERQFAKGPAFRTQFVDKVNRMLSPEFEAVIKKSPVLLENAHIVDLELSSGEKISNVFVVKNKEILGVYNREAFDFDVNEVAAVSVVKKEKVAKFEESKWLRLDGRA